MNEYEVELVKEILSEISNIKDRIERVEKLAQALHRESKPKSKEPEFDSVPISHYV